MGGPKPTFTQLRASSRRTLDMRMPPAFSTRSDRGARTTKRVLGENYATAAGSIYSDRVVGGFGAVICADRGVPCIRLTPPMIPCIWRRCVLTWLLRQTFRRLPRRRSIITGSAVRFARAATAARLRSTRLLPHFCKPSTPIPARFLAGSGGQDIDCSRRLQRPGPRAPRPFPDLANTRMTGAATAAPMGAVQ